MENEGHLINARDYFFTFIAPEHAGRNYQAVYHSGLREAANREEANKEEVERIWPSGGDPSPALEHVPNRSNDSLIEHYMTNLVAEAPTELRARLEKTFVAKVRDFEANAAAVCHSDEYSGDLVFFHVGLSDVCFQYAILYYEFIRLIAERHKNDDATTEVERLRTLVEQHTTKLAIAQARWNAEGEIRFTHQDVVRSDSDLEGYAVSVATFADQFILCHEIAHHFLGHTSGGSMSLLERVPEDCRFWAKTPNQSHQQEYEADAGAIVMQLGQNGSGVGETRELEVCVGSLLTLTVLGQLVPNVDHATLTHPSVSSRFDQVLGILSRKCEAQGQLNAVVGDFKRFQTLLHGIQGRGLGGRWGLGFE